jgi:class 3 adenylate cyclase
VWQQWLDSNNRVIACKVCFGFIVLVEADTLFCRFGDTMNTASRMESSGETDKIQLSLATAALVKSCMEFKLIYRGLVVVKGKGEMATFWLEPGMPPIKRGLQ